MTEKKVFTIYINNLPADTTQEQVSEMFNKYGDVKSVRLLPTDSGECRGYAFLDYDTEEEMNRAIAEGNDAEFRGKRINVEKSRHLLGDPPRSKRLGPSRMMHDYRYINRDQPRRYRDELPEFRRYRPDYSMDPNSINNPPLPIPSSVRYRDGSPRRYRDGYSRYRDDPMISYPKRDRDDSPPPYRRIPTGRYDRYDRPDRERYGDDRYNIIDRDYQPRIYRNYTERKEDSPPPIMRIIDDSPPPLPRRIIDDSPPPSQQQQQPPTQIRMNTFDDSTQYRRLRDDYAREDSPPRRRIIDDSPTQQPSASHPNYNDDSPSRKRFRDD